MDRGTPMRFFTEADKVFNGDKSACKTEDDVDGYKTSELKPSQSGGIYAEPHCLTDNDIRFSGFFIGETFVEEVNDGQECAGKRHQYQSEESPAGPDVWIGLCEKKIQTTPANEDQNQ